MTVRYEPSFLKRVKKLDVRIRKSFRQQITLFQNNPFAPQLNNHALKREYVGFKSIDITSDYRALYVEKDEGGEIIAYFIAIGTHKELYGREN